MIAQLQAPKHVTSRRIAEELDETSTLLYQAIPDHVDPVPNPEYLLPGAERELFGPDAPAIPVSQWRPAAEIDDGQDELPTPRTVPNLSRQNETLLFRRYNCARYNLGALMEKQTRRFAQSRVPGILAWNRRALENRSALIQANMALVVAMAKRVRASSVDFGELVSEGNMALLRAVDKFDFSRGFKFSTYACCAILRTYSRLAAKAGTYRQRFPTNFEPEWEQSDEVDRRHIDQHDLALEDLRRGLVLNEAGLTDIEQTVVGARFAVVGHDRVHTLEEVSGLVRLSAERVRQVQNKALTKLRLALEPAFAPVMAIAGKASSGLANRRPAPPVQTDLGVLVAAG